MASTKILCRNVLAPLMESYGFLRHSIGNGRYLESYYRQINDVLQVLTFLKRGKLYSFAYDIYPVSLGITDLEVDIYDLTRQRGEWPEWIRKNRPWQLWNYRTAWRQWWEEEELIETNFEEPIRMIKECFIPIFERGIDAQSAYEQVTTYEKTIMSGIIMHSTKLLRLCLQFGDYETAQLHIEAVCKGCSPTLYKERNDQLPHITEYWDNVFAKFNYQLQMIRNRDTEYWDKVLAEGTKITLDYLESIKPKRRSKK